METKDKKYNVILGIMIFLFVIIIAAVVAWGLGYIHFETNTNSDAQKENTNNGSTAESGKEPVQDNTSSNTQKENENSGGKTEDQNTEKSNAKKLEEAYKKYDFNWASKIKNDYTEDEPLGDFIKYNVKDLPNEKPKYDCRLPGHELTGLAIVMESGKVYTGDVDFLEGGNPSYSISKLNEIKMPEKIVDVCLEGKSKGEVPYSGPYFMTESGKVINMSGILYDDINRDHVDMMGFLIYMMYICKDGTIDLPRTETEYIKVVDDKGNNIKASKIFIDNLDYENGIYVNNGKIDIYIIDVNNKVYVLTPEDNGVACSYSNIQGKTVSKFKYDSKKYILKFTHTDGTSREFFEIQEAYDVENRKYM